MSSLHLVEKKYSLWVSKRVCEDPQTRRTERMKDEKKERREDALLAEGTAFPSFVNETMFRLLVAKRGVGLVAFALTKPKPKWRSHLIQLFAAVAPSRQWQSDALKSVSNVEMRSTVEFAKTAPVLWRLARRTVFSDQPSRCGGQCHLSLERWSQSEFEVYVA